MIPSILESFINNLELYSFINIIISFIWFNIKKKEVESKLDYWKHHLTQIKIWTPTVILSLFLSHDSINTIVYSSLYVSCFLVFKSLQDYYKKFEK